VQVKKIRWIDAAGDYMCIHTDTDHFIVRTTMKKLEQELDHAMFQRIHKSTLVNINCVKRIQTLRNNESLLDLGNDTKLKVSRNYNDAVKQKLQQRLSNKQ
jgi:two-component system LytT family response regulator